MKIKVSLPLGIHELGARDNQEDSIYPLLGKASTNSRLFLVCDGMGGHEGGEVASKAVCLAMSNFINSHFNGHEEIFKTDVLSGALKAAYEELDKRDNGQVSKMGTTLTLLLIHRGGIIAAHVGDSRIYHMRPATREILYKSRDHSLINDLVDAGEMTRAEANVSSRKNIITRALMPRESRPVRPEVAYITDIKPGDYFYLCSDGMLEQMDDQDILNLLSDKYESNETKRDRLINATTENRDNHSAYIIQIDSVEAEPGDEQQPNNEATKNYDDSVMAEDMHDNDIQLVAHAAPAAMPTPMPQTPAAPVPPAPAAPVQMNAPQQPPQPAKKPWALIALAVVLVALLAVGAAFFFKNKDNDKNNKEKTEQVENKKDSNDNEASKNKKIPDLDDIDDFDDADGDRPAPGTPQQGYQRNTSPVTAPQPAQRPAAGVGRPANTPQKPTTTAGQAAQAAKQQTKPAAPSATDAAKKATGQASDNKGKETIDKTVKETKKQATDDPKQD